MSHSQGFAEERAYELLGIVLLCLTTVLFLSLVTDGYTSQGEFARPFDGMSQVPNLLGAPGAVMAGVLAILVGDAAHVLYGITFVWALMLLTHRPLDRLISRTIGLVVLVGASWSPCAAALPSTRPLP